MDVFNQNVITIGKINKMSKFDNKYKRVNKEWKNGGMFQGKEEYACMMCWEPTKWVEPTFNVNICSDGCYNKLWKDYKEHMKMD